MYHRLRNCVPSTRKMTGLAQRAGKLAVLSAQASFALVGFGLGAGIGATTAPIVAILGIPGEAVAGVNSVMPLPPISVPVGLMVGIPLGALAAIPACVLGVAIGALRGMEAGDMLFQWLFLYTGASTLANFLHLISPELAKRYKDFMYRMETSSVPPEGQPADWDYQ